MVRSVRYEERPVEHAFHYDRRGILDGGGGSRVGFVEEREEEKGDRDAIRCMCRGEAILVMVGSYS